MTTIKSGTSISAATFTKEFLKHCLWPLMPGWPDEGRTIVQTAYLRDLLADAVRGSRPLDRILNAGAGEGSYSRMLLALPGVKSMVEMDISFNTKPPHRIDPRQIFFASSLDRMPVRNQTMDLVLCTEVLEHIQDDGRAVDELVRVLAPCGWLVLTVPTPPALPDAAHVREGYRPAQLKAMLTQRGLEVVKTRFCMFWFFRFILGHWHPRRGVIWWPRGAIRMLARLDTWFHIGPPMDLLILAQRPAGLNSPGLVECHGRDRRELREQVS